MKRRMSFSQALSFLQERGVTVEHLGRLDTYGCLMWRIGEQLLDKDSVIRYAEAAKANES